MSFDASLCINHLERAYSCTGTEKEDVSMVACDSFQKDYRPVCLLSAVPVSASVTETSGPVLEAFEICL